MTTPLQKIKRKGNAIYKKRYQPKHKLNGDFKKSKLGKYNAGGLHLDGKWFASNAEANRYHHLDIMLKLGKIGRLELQPTYSITVDGHPICSYRGDFRYQILDDLGNPITTVLEDVKGMVTPEYRLKKKLVEAKYKLKVHELPASWLKHFEELTAPECLPIIARLEAEKKARAIAKKAAMKLKHQTEATV